MDHNRIVKTLLALLISCLSLSAATLYPVMTDSTNRLFPGGVTNASLLNGTNTFTGTNTLNTNSILGTNRIADVVGEGGRWRLLYRHGATNWTPVTMTAATNTLFSITLPPLMSAYSQVMMRYFAWRTNVTAQPSWGLEFRANSTNGPTLTGLVNAPSATTYYAGSPNSLTAGGPAGFVIFGNYGSFNRQICHGTNYQVASPVFDLGWDTTQATNKIHVMLINSSAAGVAPLEIEVFEILERY